MSDPQDRRMADLFEIELRRKAELDPNNSWELVWFLRLPLEVRCSYMRILEARIDQDPTRRFLFRQSCYRQSNWRKPKSDVMFLQLAEPPRPWASIGQRKRRQPAEPARSRTRRPRKASATAPARGRAPVPKPPSSASVAPKRRTVTQSHPRSLKSDPDPPQADPPDLFSVPERPATPLELRHSVMSNEMLTFEAGGIDPRTGNRYHSHTPLNPATPSPATTPEVLSPAQPMSTEPAPVQPVYPPGPLFRPRVEYRPASGPVDMDLAFIVSVGMYHRAPWGVGEFPMADATLDIALFDEVNPGVISSLAGMLFPNGTRQPQLAIRPVNEALLNLVTGWLVLPHARANGRMPLPRQRCPCGQGVVMG